LFKLSILAIRILLFPLHNLRRANGNRGLKLEKKKQFLFKIKSTPPDSQSFDLNFGQVLIVFCADETSGVEAECLPLRIGFSTKCLGSRVKKS